MLGLSTTAVAPSACCLQASELRKAHASLRQELAAVTADIATAQQEKADACEAAERARLEAAAMRNKLRAAELRVQTSQDSRTAQLQACKDSHFRYCTKHSPKCLVSRRLDHLMACKLSAHQVSDGVLSMLVTQGMSCSGSSVQRTW